MGSVVLSVDAELNWTAQNLDTLSKTRRRRINNHVDSWNWLQSSLNDYNIPATWAIVGHLFLSECDGLHTDLNTPTSDWFNCSDEQGWIAPELVNNLIQSDVNHDIGSHSFSHVDFSHSGCTEDVVRSELLACRQAADRWDVNLRSFVFPRNEVYHKDILGEYGFKCYRGKGPGKWYDDVPGRPILKAIDILSQHQPPLVTPTVETTGIVNIPSSLYFFTARSDNDLLDARLTDAMIGKAKRGIQAAAESEGVFHLWLHPNNLSKERYRDGFREVLSYIAKYRDRGKINIRTMDDIAVDVGA